jgi:hypothetical protein
MAVYKWERAHSHHFGDVWVPFVHIQLQAADGRFRELKLQIDSGAVVSLLRRSAAELLGLDLETGRPVALSSVGDGGSEAFVHELQIRFDDGQSLVVPFAIASREDVPNLLGRRGVFDSLQIDFDPTLQQTQVRPPWLDAGNRRIWDVVIGTEKQVLNHWKDAPLPEPADRVAATLMNRAEQIFAAASGLMRLGMGFEAPPLVREMFEVAAQFEYLMQEPAPRAQRYLDYLAITRHKLSQRWPKDAKGLIGRQVSQSPLRPEGEKRNVEEFERVKPLFQRGNKRIWDKWYCMSIADLAKEIGWKGEYAVVYSSAAAWSHADPFATHGSSLYPGFEKAFVFIVCYTYYGRMLSRIADAKSVILTAEQVEFLGAVQQRIE